MSQIDKNSEPKIAVEAPKDIEKKSVVKTKIVRKYFQVSWLFTSKISSNKTYMSHCPS